MTKPQPRLPILQAWQRAGTSIILLWAYLSQKFGFKNSAYLPAICALTIQRSARRGWDYIRLSAGSVAAFSQKGAEIMAIGTVAPKHIRFIPIPHPKCRSVAVYNCCLHKVYGKPEKNSSALLYMLREQGRGNVNSRPSNLDTLWANKI